MARKAVVAMSGGVDSSVAAALLVQEGFDVTGIMLKLWRGEAANTDSGCCNVGAADDARRVADILGIPFYVLNFAEEFEDSVIRDFHESYASGRTPNPCVRCNQWIKFGTLLERADALGAEILATGHYARLRRNESGYRLLRGRDANKDQSYVLWMLGQEELERCRFPIGEMEKTETRRIATELGLRTAAKPDSQEICFVREGNLGAYVEENLPAASAPGPILDTRGNVVGEHRGIGRYTIGQRKGLGLSLGVPVYVTSIDADSQTLTVGDSRDLLVGGLRADETSFVNQPLPSGGEVLIQHRAHGAAAAGRIVSRAGAGIELEYAEPVEAVAPGQSIAFYSTQDPDELLGGGVISSTIPAAAAVF
ncbi:MAG: tRNA 2-thiouridine(34) synthase MnmA [Actinomycetota bacterium]|nr:tRNA 2-thiouridine(34) synthase MnmA [Actinomycetota bacterium]